MRPRFFATSQEWRAWLEANHARATELLVGFRKVGSGPPSLTWPEAVDEALCFGWIDGTRRRIDDGRYAVRFTPRKPGSTWSARNVGRVQALEQEGRMRPAGLAAFAARRAERTATYSYEPRPQTLDPEYQRELEADAKAWTFFRSKAPSYQKAAVAWVLGAKKEETRRARLATLIRDSAAGRTVAPLTRPTSKRGKG